MTDRLLDIRRLIPVLDMAFRAEQLKLAHIARRIAAFRAQLADLDRPESFDPMSVASRTGADQLWEIWVQDRKTLINREMALALRDREAAREKLVATLAKLEAARQMEARASAQARQTAQRRSSW